MVGNAFNEEIFPNPHSKPLLALPEAISFQFVTFYLGEETNLYLATTSCQLVAERDLGPESPFLQAKHIQHPHCSSSEPQTLPQLHCPSLDML